MKRVLILAAALVLMAVPLRAQTDDLILREAAEGSTFSAALAGTNAPLQIRLGDMSADWRQIQASGSDEDLLTQIYQSGNARNPRAEPFYTRGQNFRVGEEDFIVAYRLPPQTGAEILRDPYRNYPVVPQKLTLDTQLELALLNPRLISRFTRIRVLDVEATLAENGVAVQNAQTERKRLINQAVSNYLRQIGQAVQSYVSATEKLPSLQNIQAVENAVKRYSYSEPSPFVHPEPGKSFRTVTQLSGKTTKAIKNPAKTIIIYESAMATDGNRGVVFADGSGDRVIEAEFTRLLNLSTQVTKTGTVSLYRDAALSYLYWNVPQKGQRVQYFVSETSGRIYYRDNQTRGANFYALAPNTPLIVEAAKAKNLSGIRGYNNQKTGRVFKYYGDKGPVYKDPEDDNF